ncbi:Ig-like domain-containing protein [Paenibacillus sp. FSL R7-0345]|uniref:Ig-like domain-containing protein n=1 Tax=Paenibacillus sp. FSL R7-0345 TaxID=2954535 RepID=UPI003159B955
MDKKVLLAAILSLFFVVLVPYSTPVIYADQTLKVISISVAGPARALKPKQTYQLKPDVVTLPQDSNVKIAYSSANTQVATVNMSGLVTAVSPGKAIIYASSGGKSTYAVIKVDSSAVKLTTGLWVEKKNIKKPKEQLLTEGAVYFKLKSFDNHVLTGHFFAVSAPPSNRIADVEIKTTLKNGKGSFSYTDDGWGNSGEGTVEMKGGTLEFSFKETQSDSMAMWQLGTHIFILYKSES